MKLDDNAVATLAKVSDLIEQWHEEALDRYAWDVEYQRNAARPDAAPGARGVVLGAAISAIGVSRPVQR